MEEENISSAAQLRPELIQDTCKKLSECVRTVNTFPTGAARDLYSTYTGFNAVVEHLSECVLTMANSILQAQGMRVKLNKETASLHSLVLVNDEILDQIGLTAKPGTSDEILEQISDKAPRLQRKHPAPAYTPCNRGDETPIKTYTYLPPRWLQQQQHAGVLLREVEGTPFEYIDTAEALGSLVRHLDTVRHFGVDLEHYEAPGTPGVTCLIQLTTERGDYIVDCLALKAHVHTLNSSFANKNTIKVLHGARSDVQWLKRDFNIHMAGLFDTHEAAILLQLPNKKLKDLVSFYCGVELDKGCQRSNWSVRPLEEAQIKYARLDTHYLLYIWQRMIQQLRQNEEDDLVSMAYYNSAKIIKKSNKPASDAYKMLYQGAGKVLGDDQDRVLKSLYTWRLEVANEKNESMERVAPSYILIKLAERLPRTPEDVKAVCGDVTPLVASNLTAICEVIANSLQSEPAASSSEQGQAVAAASEAASCCLDLDPNNEMRPQPTRGVQSKVLPVELPERKVVSADHLAFVPPYRRYQLYKCWLQIESSKTAAP